MNDEQPKYDVTLAEWLALDHTGHVTRSGKEYWYWRVPGDKATRTLWSGPEIHGKADVIRMQHKYQVHNHLFNGKGATERVMADYPDMQANYEHLMETYEREAYAQYYASVHLHYQQEREREIQEDLYG